MTELLAFLDETGHAADTAHVGIAGLFADVERWPEFDVSWEEALRTAGVSDLHMRHLAHFKGQYNGWSDDRRRALLRHAVQAIHRLQPVVAGAIMSMSVWRSASERQRRALVDPYYACFQEVVGGIATSATVQGHSARVILSRNTEFGPKARLLWDALRRRNDHLSLVNAVCEFGDPGAHPGLQAADLVAYELLQAAKAREQGRTPTRWPYLQLLECSHHFTFIDQSYMQWRCPPDEVLRRVPGLE